MDPYKRCQAPIGVLDRGLLPGETSPPPMPCGKPHPTECHELAMRFEDLGRAHRDEVDARIRAVTERDALREENAGLTQGMIDALDERNAALKMLERVIASASPNKRDHPAMYAAWNLANELLAKAAMPDGPRIARSINPDVISVAGAIAYHFVEWNTVENNRRVLEVLARAVLVLCGYPVPPEPK